MKLYNPFVPLVLFVLLLVPVGNVKAQDRSLQTDGWQGPRPAPQSPPATPFPQPSGPPGGKQTLEIPPQPQATLPPPVNQEVTIPPVLQPSLPKPALQPPSTRPSQLLTVTVTDRDGRYITDLRPEDFVEYGHKLCDRELWSEQRVFTHPQEPLRSRARER